MSPSIRRKPIAIIIVNGESNPDSLVSFICGSQLNGNSWGDGFSSIFVHILYIITDSCYNITIPTESYNMQYYIIL